MTETFDRNFGCKLDESILSYIRSKAIICGCGKDFQGSRQAASVSSRLVSDGVAVLLNGLNHVLDDGGLVHLPDWGELVGMGRRGKMR